MPDKAVTIVVFGPSLKLGIPIVGEMWTINRAYAILTPQVMNTCTRYFEMHTREKLVSIRAADKLPHLHHLDLLGKSGRRIVMQEKMDDVTNSEAFPVTAMRARWPHSMLSGGEQFPFSMALYEGYTHIRIIGVDLNDMRHACHREGMMWWIGMAMGMGVTVDGPLRLLDRYTKIYGYDYGGYGEKDWNEYQRAHTWEAFPCEINMKADWMPCVSKME